MLFELTKRAFRSEKICFSLLFCLAFGFLTGAYLEPFQTHLRC
ncbi:hypothetical protein A343_0816 [Porphyromonas gingivalis JCVI SC001]|nr:hypothetical protein A343_0816 [Porphyromonas gingivalis JCVI SC001]